VIRVNLIGERKAAKKKIAFPIAQQVTAICGAVLVAAALGVGWRYWSLQRESTRINADLANVQNETARLHAVIAQVQEFEQRKNELQQRVQLIEQLRDDQTGPVHMLDQISRALPPMLWLTQLKETPTGNDVTIEGRSTTLTGISDFVANLESSGYFQKSIEIVSTNSETTPAGEMIKFQIKVIFKTPGDGKPVAASAPAPAPRGA
jgi:type IV pilus assembly protein PilN